MEGKKERKKKKEQRSAFPRGQAMPEASKNEQAMLKASRERGPDLVGASVKKPLHKGD